MSLALRYAFVRPALPANPVALAVRPNWPAGPLVVADAGQGVTLL